MPTDSTPDATPPIPGNTAAGNTGTRAEIFAWCLYDWAISAYSTLSITMLMIYITSVLAPGGAGNLIWAYGISGTMLIAAIASPVLGAVADAHASKRFWLALMTLLGAGGAIGMAVVSEDQVYLAVGFFLLAQIGYETSQCFYNGFLPEIANDETMNPVSARGFGLGYIGGGLALVIAIAVAMNGDKLGFPHADAPDNDYHYTDGNTLVVEVTPGEYDVILRAGDPGRRREGMLFVVGDVSLAPISAAAGEIVERSAHVDADSGRIEIAIAGDGGDRGDAPSAVINSLRLVKTDDERTASLDFVTVGSSLAEGYLSVRPTDDFPVAIADVIQRDESEPPATEASLITSFGWTTPNVAARDAVKPLRLRAALGLMGVWWGLFALPTIFLLRDRGEPKGPRQSLAAAAVGGLKQVTTTLRSVRRFPMLFIFLVAFLVYNDGVQTVITQAGPFAQEAFNITAEDLMMVVLMIQFVALPGALGVGWISERVGPYRTLLGCLAVWVLLLFAAFFVTTIGQFWCMGFVVALVLGGTQSVSRAVMGLMTPEKQAAEFFGFFNLSGKAASPMGPFLFGTILALTKSPHIAILSLLVFFVVGTLLVIRIDIPRGQREARAADAA
jgi:MFS-type transporter involved in bile tolerance (Atg22 family)